MVVALLLLSCTEFERDNAYDWRADNSIYSGKLSYGGQTYKTIKIGNQNWMAENLNYNVGECSCNRQNYEDTCDKYGMLYTWETAMTACPPGWHLPSNEEWQILVDFVGGFAAAGKKLKAKNWDGANEYGFSALPGGYGNYAGHSGAFDGKGYWWSSDGCNWVMRSGYNDISNTCYNADRYSVRCVED